MASKVAEVPKNWGFAFSFDIDGVLLHSKTKLPHSTETLTHLIKNNIPFIFLTNSGGAHESKRIKDLSKTWSVPLDVDQFVQSHTPFQDMVPEYRDKTVLVIGGVGDACRQVALQYGFKLVITSADIISAYPSIWPFNDISPKYYTDFAQPLPKPITPSDPANSLQVSAILVFNSSRDWGFDAQICLDLLLADSGILGTQSPLNGNASLPNHGYQQQEKSTKIFFANPDFVWKTNWAHGARFGQGAFKTALEAIFHEATEEKAILQKSLVGKPCRASFLYGENVLISKRARMMGGQVSTTPFQRVYMIGDNPLSDIAGANSYSSPHGTKWESILVETGVHVAGAEPRVKPTVTVADVRDAVNWALRREGLPEME